MKTFICAETRAINKIEALGGIIHTKTAINAGIYSRTLADLVQKGKIEKLARGIYRLTSRKSANQDLVTVVASVPKSVICLISALSFHQMTTQIPHAVDIAIPKASRTPRVKYPPLTVYRFGSKAYSSGVEKHIIEGISICVYNPEKTIADCFKFRNRIGLDIVIEAMKLYKSRKKFDVKLLMRYARICRVEKQMTPYLEAIA